MSAWFHRSSASVSMKFKSDLFAKGVVHVCILSYAYTELVLKDTTTRGA